MSYSGNITAANEILNASFAERPRSMFVLRPPKDDAIGLVFMCIISLGFFLIISIKHIAALCQGYLTIPLALLVSMILCAAACVVLLALSPLFFKSKAEVRDDIITVKGREYHTAEIQEIRIVRNITVNLISADKIFLKLSMGDDNCDELICWARYYHIHINKISKN